MKIKEEKVNIAKDILDTSSDIIFRNKRYHR